MAFSAENIIDVSLAWVSASDFCPSLPSPVNEHKSKIHNSEFIFWMRRTYHIGVHTKYIITEDNNTLNHNWLLTYLLCLHVEFQYVQHFLFCFLSITSHQRDAN